MKQFFFSRFLCDVFMFMIVNRLIGDLTAGVSVAGLGQEAAGLGLSCGCLERGAGVTGRTVEVALVVY